MIRHKNSFLVLLSIIILLVSTNVFALINRTPSNTVIFTITGSSLAITSISPSLTNAGGPDFVLTVIGTNFKSGYQVKFNGVNKITTFISEAQLTAQITSLDIANAGSYNITVVNPNLGGETSNAVLLEVKEVIIFPEILPPLMPLADNLAQKIADSLVGIAKNSKTIKKSFDSVIVFTEYIKKVVETPTGSIITKALTASGVAVAASAIAFATSFSLLEILLIPVRLWGLLLSLLGIRKKNLPWGVVYDSVTKQPLDPAYVILKNIRGKEVGSAITDLDGRYGFLMSPGIYYIEAKKTNYAFPSKKVSGFDDEVYNNLYFGEKIEVMQGQIIKKNIPLDPVKFDWNEFAKKNKNFMRFYSKWDIIIRKISNPTFIIGFIIALLVLIFAPSPYNIIIFALYIMLLLLKIAMKATGIQPKSVGYIIEKNTGIPISFAIMRIMSPSTNTEISSKVADKYGRYYCLVPKGKYYVKIEKKNSDESYSLIHTSGIIDASKKGIIKEKFQV